MGWNRVLGRDPRNGQTHLTRRLLARLINNPRRRRRRMRMRIHHVEGIVSPRRPLLLRMMLLRRNVRLG
jgi:hypothetical protein